MRMSNVTVMITESTQQHFPLSGDFGFGPFSEKVPSLRPPQVVSTTTHSSPSQSPATLLLGKCSPNEQPSQQQMSTCAARLSRFLVTRPVRDSVHIWKQDQTKVKKGYFSHLIFRVYNLGLVCQGTHGIQLLPIWNTVRPEKTSQTKGTSTGIAK